MSEYDPFAPVPAAPTPAAPAPAPVQTPPVPAATAPGDYKVYIILVCVLAFLQVTVAISIPILFFNYENAPAFSKLYSTFTHISLYLPYITLAVLAFAAMKLPAKKRLLLLSLYYGGYILLNAFIYVLNYIMILEKYTSSSLTYTMPSFPWIWNFFIQLSNVLIYFCFFQFAQPVLQKRLKNKYVSFGVSFLFIALAALVQHYFSIAANYFINAAASEFLHISKSYLLAFPQSFFSKVYLTQYLHDLLTFSLSYAVLTALELYVLPCLKDKKCKPQCIEDNAPPKPLD